MNLTKRVPVAWPTLLLTAATTLVWVGSTAGALMGVLPWWVAMLVNTAAACAAFTPMHDASHKSVGKARWLNEIVGRVSALPLLAPFGAFRWLHLEHHKHTNNPERDPDYWSGTGPRWMLPLRWLTQDLHYYVLYYAALRRRPVAERREAIVTLLAMYGAAIGLSLAGFVMPVVLLWLVPARIATGLLSFGFDYLPHRPHDVPASENRYAATAIIINWWLTPLFLYQNYHLIHHLFPAVPFYRYVKVWKARESELRAKGAKVETLTLRGRSRGASLRRHPWLVFLRPRA
jgi:beta-carotene hydroxylase